VNRKEKKGVASEEKFFLGGQGLKKGWGTDTFGLREKLG